MQTESQITVDTANDLHILRLGYHDRANLMPLLYPLKAGWVGAESPWKLEVVNMTPTALVSALLDGELDAAFIAPFALTQRGDRLASLGGWGLASEGASETTLLLAPQRLDLMDEGHLALSEEAQASTAAHLLRVLLKPYYDITLSLHAPGDSAYDLKGARLLYSDDAPRQAKAMPEGWVAEDMGVAGYVMSGLPTVWEMLVAPRDLEARKPGASEAIQATLKASQRAAQEQQATILEEATQRLGLDQPRVKELFARQRYTLGEKEQKGLAHFFTLASKAGLAAR
jgi:chorismate dehydratase